MKIILQSLTLVLCMGAAVARLDGVSIASNGDMVATSLSKEPYIPAVQSHLSIQIPHTLRSHHQGEHHELARFGLTAERGSMSRYVYLVEKSLCHSNAIDQNTTYPARGGDEHNKWVSPFFILAANEGMCTPVKMARNAQAFGASGLILTERLCRCNDQNCTDTFTDDSHCLDKEPPLVDDGSALDVSIPTILMHKSERIENLYDFVKGDQPAMMEFTWGLPIEDEELPEGEEMSEFKPHIHLWTAAHDMLMKHGTYDHLRALVSAFGDTIHFSPRYYILDGKEFGCHLHSNKVDEDSPCHHLCTNGGRYCAGHAIHVNGKEVITETLRRICIYQNYPAFPENHKRGEKANTAFFDYSMYHLEHCSEATLYNSTKCIEDAYKAAKITRATIDMCISDSGDLTKDAPNGLLDDMLKKREYSNVVHIPSLMVKNGIDKHTIRTRDLFEEVCQQFWDATMHSPYVANQNHQVHVPQICDTCGSCPNVIGCLKEGHCVPWGANRGPHRGEGAKKGGHGWFITFLIFGILVAGGAYYYYKQRSDFGDAGTGLLHGYMQMSSS